MPQYIYPFPAIRKHYREMMNGRVYATQEFNLAEYPDHSLNELYDLAHDRAASYRGNMYYQNGLLDVSRPMRSDCFEGWVVEVFPSIKLTHVVEHLDAHLAVNKSTGEADVEATKDWLRERMRIGVAKDCWFFDTIAHLQDDPEFTDLMTDVAVWRIFAEENRNGLLEAPPGTLPF